MKHMSTNNQIARFAAVLGLSALFAGTITLSPAYAYGGQDGRDQHRDDGGRDQHRDDGGRDQHRDDRGRDDRGRDQHRDDLRYHYDSAMLQREKDHLHDLYRRRDDLKRRHDWDAVKRVTVAITDTKWRIDHTSFDKAHDYDRYYSDRDRTWFQNHH